MQPSSIARIVVSALFPLEDESISMLTPGSDTCLT
jgi:hypothetical protein